LLQSQIIVFSSQYIR